MNVFQTYADIVGDYSSYIRCFISIADLDIRKGVNRELSRGKLWPEPLLQFNPAFEMFGSLEDLATSGTFRDIFRGTSSTSINFWESTSRQLMKVLSMPQRQMPINGL